MKKGFTLMELLVVIILIGVLAVLVLPGLVSNYEKSLIKAMQIQENEIKDVASLMAKDFCNQPISREKYKECYNKFQYVDEGDSVGKYVVCLKDLKEEGYYDNDLVYEKQECTAFVLFNLKNEGSVAGKTDRESKTLIAEKSYIFCGDNEGIDYITKNDAGEDDLDKVYLYNKCGDLDLDAGILSGG